MDKDELWRAILGEIELTLSRANFTTWFKNTSILEIDTDQILISVPNIFAKEWLEKRYQKEILEAVKHQLPEITGFSCVVATENTFVKNNTPYQQFKQPSNTLDLSKSNTPIINLKKPQESASNFFQRNNQPTNQQVNPNQKHFEQNSNFFQNNGFLKGFNPRYSFDSFVVGSNNELAYAACRSVAEEPAKNYNPLFIYGGVGLGKTHLLQSTGNIAYKNNPNSKVKYTSMERFTNELVDSIQNRKTKEFKNYYMQLDILILDDVQFLAGKEKTQEEFFHVFESLYQNGKQIILSSDRPPKSIPTLEDRLRSRFEGGMMADVNKPDYETRTAIIQRKLIEKNFSLNENIVDYLARNIYHNVRELEGALNKIIVTYQLKNTEPDLKDVIDLTKDVLSANRQKDLTPDKILESVAEYYDVKVEEIKGKSRKKTVAKPRQISIYLIRNEVDLSFPGIGELMGGRDHSTIIYAYEKIKEELNSNELLKDQLKFIREKFIEY